MKYFIGLALLVVSVYGQPGPLPGTSSGVPNSYASCCSGVPIVDWNFSTTGRRAYPNFSSEYGINFTYNALFGQNDETNVAKRTFIPQNLFSNYAASGQRFLYAGGLIASGLGDAITQSFSLGVLGRSSAGGDEGQYLYRGTINNGEGAPFTATLGTPSATTCNTTTTQAISRVLSGSGQAPSSVTVAATTNCSVNQWVTIASAPNNTFNTNEEVVQITAVGAGSISAVFLKDHLSGVTVTPANVLPIVAGAYSRVFGQDRTLVDLTQIVTGPGTVSAGGLGSVTVTGSGTSFSNAMIGGTANNPGCIAINSDTVGGVRSWFPVDVVSSTTSLTIYVQTGSRIKTASGSTYFLAPCARIRNFVFNSANPPAATALVLSNNPFTWTAADSVECSVSPDPYISGFHLTLYPTLPHAQWNSPFLIENLGSRDIFSPGYDVKGSTSGGFTTGFQAINTNNGLQVTSDGVHTGDAVAVAMMAGDSKPLEWTGVVTGSNFQAWKLGPVDATGVFSLLDGYASPAAIWTAYPGTSASQLRFEILGGTKAVHFAGASTPAVAAGGAIGTTPTINGTDFVGTITVPSSAVTIGTLFTVTFATAYGSAPNCVVQQNGGAVNVGVGHSQSASVLTVTSAIANISASAYSFDFVCSGS